MEKREVLTRIALPIVPRREEDTKYLKGKEPKSIPRRSLMEALILRLHQLGRWIMDLIKLAL